MLYIHSWQLLILEPEVARVATNRVSFAMSLFASFWSVIVTQCSDPMFYTFQNDHKISLATICQHTEVLRNYWLHSLSISFSWLTAFVSLWLTYFVTDSWCQFSLLHRFSSALIPTPSGNSVLCIYHSGFNSVCSSCLRIPHRSGTRQCWSFSI